MENFCTENENMPESWTWVDAFWVAFAGGVWCDEHTEQMHILYVQNITRLLGSCACDLGKQCWRHLRVLQAGFWICFNIFALIPSPVFSPNPHIQLKKSGTSRRLHQTRVTPERLLWSSISRRGRFLTGGHTQPPVGRGNFEERKLWKEGYGGKQGKWWKGPGWWQWGAGEMIGTQSPAQDWGWWTNCSLGCDFWRLEPSQSHWSHRGKKKLFVRKVQWQNDSLSFLLS